MVVGHDQCDAPCVSHLPPAGGAMIDANGPPEILRIMKRREEYPSGGVHIEAGIVPQPGSDLGLTAVHQTGNARHPPTVDLHWPEVDGAIAIPHFRTNPSPLLPPQGPQRLGKPWPAGRGPMDTLIDRPLRRQYVRVGRLTIGWRCLNDQHGSEAASQQRCTTPPDHRSRPRSRRTSSVRSGSLGCEISGCGWFRSIRSMSAVRVSAARSPTPAKPLGLDL